MWALDGSVEAPTGPFAAGTPAATLVVLGVGLCGTAALVRSGWAPAAALGVAAVTAGHGTLLATALAWTAWDDTPRWEPRPAIASVVVAVALAGAIGAWAPHLRAIAYAMPPAVYAVLVARGRLAALGVRRSVPVGGVILGMTVGAALGAHLLHSASLTLGYRLRTDGAAAYLSAFAYDAGVNIASSELFFRGALLRRTLARWSVGTAMAFTTGAGVLRYLVDPLLPHAPETIAGAVLYLTLLGVANAWLATSFGSIVPALASSAVFFAAYRLLVLA